MSSERPSVDVVVPFRGGAEERRALLARMSELALRDGDTLTVVDNGPQPPDELGDEPSLVHAPEIPTSYYARNRGAQRGRAEWILFLDADVLAPADLLDRYFEPGPAERVGVLGGGVRDEVPADLDGATLAVRYAALHQPMSHELTLRDPRPEWTYAQTANALVRRAAFDAAGGFRAGVRSGGDADLCFRLRGEGWAIEARPDAAVVHRNRTTLRALARQKARHGSGSAWLNREYPGVFPRTPWYRSAAYALRLLSRDGAAVALSETVGALAFAFGRLLPNEPRTRTVR